MNTVDDDAQHHCVPLVLVFGLEVPQNDDSWCWHRFFAAQKHPLLDLGEELLTGESSTTAGLDEPIQFPELFNLLSAKSPGLALWKPPIDRRKAILNFSFLDSRVASVCGGGGRSGKTSPYRLPPAKQLNQNTLRFEYKSGELHSPIAPGEFFSLRWVQKYLYLLPATFLVFARLPPLAPELRPGADDNILIQRLQALKLQLEKRHVRMIVVLVHDSAVAANVKLSDRRKYFRKQLDLKKASLYFLSAGTTGSELCRFCETLVNACYSIAQDFYADAAKRVRNRSSGIDKHGADPAVTALWRLQYQYKQAVFQEFRQDLSETVRMYESTYESASEYLTSLPLPRSAQDITLWSKLRRLLDILAFKIINFALLTRTPSIAYLKFQVHLRNISEIIQTKGSSSSLDLWGASMYFMLAGLLDQTGNIYIENGQSIARGSDEELPNECLPRPGSLYLSGASLLFKLLSSATEILLPKLYLNHFTKATLINDLKIALNRASNDFSLGANERCVGYTLYLLGESYFCHDRDYIAALAYYKTSLQRARLDQGLWPEIAAILLNRIKETADLTRNYKDCIIADFNLNLVDETHELDSRHDKWTAAFENSIIDLTKAEKAPNIYDANFWFNQEVQIAGGSASFQIMLQNHLKHNKQVWLQSVAIELSGAWTGTTIITHNSQPSSPESGFVRFQLTEFAHAGDNKVIELSANLNASKEGTLIIEVSFQPNWTGSLTVSYTSFTTQFLILTFFSV
jgi:hypothetical protein